MKTLSGFYYVESDGKIITTRGRGKLKHEKISPMVGDLVEFTQVDETTGILESVLPRKNSFIRPAVANIDCMVIFASAAVPVTDPFLIDRMTVICEKNNCEPIICINKCDLKSGDEYFKIYHEMGYKTILTSAKTGEGVQELLDALKDKTCAFTGNSGVGKSSILNMINPNLQIETGEVSTHLKRGKHTTRHVELYQFPNNARIMDTPGFSSFDLNACGVQDKSELMHLFPEFEPFIGECRYNDCAHVKDKGCRILQAIDEGKVNASRHKSYVRLYTEASAIDPWK